MPSVRPPQFDSKLLLYFSYNGCQYNGSAHHPRSKWVRPVAKVLQQHLHKFFNPHRRLSELSVSSRTDRDVHALSNSGSLLHSGTVDYLPALLRLLVNASLSAAGETARLQLVRQVPLEFSAVTQAQSRSYVYRLAVVSDGAFAQLSARPVQLWHSCWLLQPPLDTRLLRLAAGVVSGRHNFAGFTNLAGLRSAYNTNKDLRVGVAEQAWPEPLLQHCRPAAASTVQLLDITYSAHSFLYKMLRFLTGALVAVARSQLTVDSLRQVLNCPADYVSAKPFEAAPGHGLYLSSVQYDSAEHCLTSDAVLRDNASVDPDFCRLVLNRFKDCRGTFDVAELSREHAEFVAAKASGVMEQ